MKKKSRKLKSSNRLNSNLMKSSFNELRILETRPKKIVDYLPSESPKSH